MGQVTIPETPPDYDKMRVIERPDGFYWQYRGTSEEFGPFATLIEAVEDMKDGVDAAADDGLLEAEEELGIADWIDPDTGQPAEDGIPHLEDH